MDLTKAQDAESPLSKLTWTAVSQADQLSVALDDDAEAIRILSEPIALPEAIASADRQWLATQIGRQVRQRWDDRDQQRWAWMHGYSVGACPAPSRVEELLAEWGLRDNFSAYKVVFQRVLERCKLDGTASFIGQKADTLYQVHRELLALANQLTDREPPPSSRCQEWGLMREKHYRAISDLNQYPAEAHQAHPTKIFPLGDDGIDAELRAICILIDGDGPSPERTKIACDFYRDDPHPKDKARSALTRIRKLESLKPPRVVLPKKRTKRTS